MTQSRLVTAAALATALFALPAPADAQNRRGAPSGRAVPRVGPPPRPGVVRTYRPAYYRPYYRPYYYSPYLYSPLLGYPGYYGPYLSGYGFGYPPPYVYGYGGYGGYDGYGYPGYGYRGYAPYGGVRIDIPQRDAEVHVDGYFAGIVDDFDGRFQQVNLEPGPHRIEVRAQGFAPIAFDVHVEPGRTITYRSEPRPQP